MHSPTASTGPLKRAQRYKPATPEQDIARLLDPSYSTPRAADGVYVDSHGELHDPAFRDFPALAHLYALPHNRARHQQRAPRRAAAASEEEEEAFLRERECGCRHAYACARPCNCPRSVCAVAARRSPPPRAAAQLPMALPTSPKSRRKSSFSSVFSRKSGRAMTPSEHSLDSRSAHSSSSESLVEVPVFLESEECKTAMPEKKVDEEAGSDSDTQTSEHTLCSEGPSSPRLGKLGRNGWRSSSSFFGKRAEQVEAQDEPRHTLTDHMRQRWVTVSLPVRLGVFRAERKITQRLATLSQRTAGSRPSDILIPGRRSLDAVL
ncbi:hypothetical protein HDZ31DRAFT_76189 [Schizophyllum fasciatum]